MAYVTGTALVLKNVLLTTEKCVAKHKWKVVVVVCSS